MLSLSNLASCTFKDNLRSYKLSIYLSAYNTFLQTRKEKYHEKKNKGPSMSKDTLYKGCSRKLRDYIK